MTPNSNKFMTCYQNPNFPSSLLDADTLPHNQNAYASRLDDEKSRLFDEESESELDVIQKREHDQEWEEDTVKGLNLLHRKLLPHGDCQSSPDPMTRIFFIHAQDSRSKLRITYDMFLRLLTFQQTMSHFLDFIFPFGQSIEAQDVHFSGFRSSLYLDPNYKRTQISELGRSGLGYQHCFNLKSIEPTSKGRQNHPWSVRAAVAHHSFDTSSGASSFITVKGNRLFKRRISSTLKKCNLAGVARLDQSFIISLEVHTVFVDWAGEHWRWYVNFLSDKLQEVARPILNARVDVESDTSLEIRRLERQSTAADMIRKQEQLENSTKPSLWKVKDLLGFTGDTAAKHDVELGAVKESRSMDLSTPKIPFEFSDIQKLANIEENVSEAKRVLACNVDTLATLRDHYRRIWGDRHFPRHIKKDCQARFAKFQTHISLAVDDMRRHNVNLENLLGVLEVRKNVLNNMFTYRNIQESRLQAQKAQVSARNMEDMTQVMYEIARKTEQETIAMKVVTVITLFFLPATFICTFMSTDIVQYANDGNSNTPISPAKTFSLDAFKLFLELFIPFMVVTLVGSLAYYRYVKQKTNIKYINLASEFLARRIPGTETR